MNTLQRLRKATSQNMENISDRMGVNSLMNIFTKRDNTEYLIEQTRRVVAREMSKFYYSDNQSGDNSYLLELEKIGSLDNEKTKDMLENLSKFKEAAQGMGEDKRIWLTEESILDIYGIKRKPETERQIDWAFSVKEHPYLADSLPPDLSIPRDSDVSDGKYYNGVVNRMDEFIRSKVSFSLNNDDYSDVRIVNLAMHEKHTDEWLMKAVSAYPSLISELPEKERTTELLRNAYESIWENNGSGLDKLLPYIEDVSLLKEFIGTEITEGRTVPIESISPKIRLDESVYEMIVDANPTEAMKRIPKKDQSNELRLRAISQNAESLLYIDDDLFKRMNFTVRENSAISCNIKASDDMLLEIETRAAEKYTSLILPTDADKLKHISREGRSESAYISYTKEFLDKYNLMGTYQASYFLDRKEELKDKASRELDVLVLKNLAMMPPSKEWVMNKSFDDIYNKHGLIEDVMTLRSDLENSNVRKDFLNALSNRCYAAIGMKVENSSPCLAMAHMKDGSMIEIVTANTPQELKSVLELNPQLIPQDAEYLEMERDGEVTKLGLADNEDDLYKAVMTDVDGNTTEIARAADEMELKDQIREFLKDYDGNAAPDKIEMVHHDITTPLASFKHPQTDDMEKQSIQQESGIIGEDPLARWHYSQAVKPTDKEDVYCFFDDSDGSLDYSKSTQKFIYTSRDGRRHDDYTQDMQALRNSGIRFSSLNQLQIKDFISRHNFQAEGKDNLLYDMISQKGVNGENHFVSKIATKIMGSAQGMVVNRFREQFSQAWNAGIV